MSVANRSWRDTVSEHGRVSLVMLFVGPLAVWGAFASFVWYVFEGVHADDERVDVDIVRVGGSWFLYGLAWCLGLAHLFTPLL